MAFTDYLENKVLDFVFSGGSFSQPGTKYLALYTVAPTDSSAGTEVTGGGYVRQTVTLTTSGSDTTNSAAVEYPTATAGYGTVVAVAVLDASSGGNMLAYASLTANKTIATGDVFRVPAGDLDISLN
ncbi:b-glycanase [uncultured Mediterranean phage uvMED]|nr:b-glycanase [uncultured Mediterranean phage uvMED]BAQ90078.1 b-glycanase [uncultured Mediterranean phage uvMED]